MATPSITDLQSLVKSSLPTTTAFAIVKLYEATFAAMKPGKITTSALTTAKCRLRTGRAGSGGNYCCGTRHRWNGCDGRSRPTAMRADPPRVKTSAFCRSTYPRPAAVGL